MEKKKIKNYLLLFIIVLSTIIVTVYFCKIIKNNETNKLSTSPLYGSVKEITGDELDEALAEVGQSIIYFGYNGNKTVYKMEERLLKIIKKYKINDNFLYVNLTSVKDNKEYISLLNKYFVVLNEKDYSIPMLMYYDEGNVIYFKHSNNKIINEKELLNIIEDFDIDI